MQNFFVEYITDLITCVAISQFGLESVIYGSRPSESFHFIWLGLELFRLLFGLPGFNW